MKIEIVQAVPDDAVTLAKLLTLLASQTTFMMYEIEEVPKPEVLRKQISLFDQSGNIILIAKVDDSVVGYALLTRGKVTRNRGVGSVVLGVLDNNQRKGVGSKLMKSLIFWAKQNGLYRLQLHVQTCNKIACDLYQKFGFEIEGVLRRCAYIEGKYVDKFQMSLIL